MNSYDFFIYEFIYFMNSYMNSGVPRFQMKSAHNRCRQWIMARGGQCQTGLESGHASVALT